jgi:hypothetical protein
MSNHHHQGGESFVIEVTALPDDYAPPISRLKRMLKGLLRAHGFRCIACRETTSNLPPAAPGVAQDATDPSPPPVTQPASA